ncbi:hypothetical protein P8452_40777 [Trifolium repens]|nr:hypothetical protein P8452_40777 [Trifolium repens]
MVKITFGVGSAIAYRKGKHLTPLLLASRIHTHHTTATATARLHRKKFDHHHHLSVSLCSTTPPLSLCSCFQILNQHHHHRKSQSPPPPPPQKVSLSPPPFCPSLSLLYATDRWLLTLYLVRTQELLQISAVEFGESCCKRYQILLKKKPKEDPLVRIC